MKLPSFDRRTLQILRASVDEVLAQVAAKHGINARTGTIRFSPTGGNCSLTVEFATVSETGEVKTREADTFVQYAEMEGLKPESLNQEFTAGRERYKIVGMATTSRRDRILVLKLSNQKQYWMNAATVLGAFPAAAAPKPAARVVSSIDEVLPPRAV